MCHGVCVDLVAQYVSALAFMDLCLHVSIIVFSMRILVIYFTLGIF